MLEMWLSKERLLSNSKPRFLTDDEELTEQPSSIRQCFRMLHVEVFGPIIKTCFFFGFFSEFSSRKLLVIQFFISTINRIVISTINRISESEVTYGQVW